MHEPVSNNQTPERAYLFGVESKSEKNRLWSIEDSLSELTRLSETAGLEVVGVSSQRLPHPDPATYAGQGKLSEIKLEMLALEARTLVLDDELKPGQQRNLEEQLSDDIKVVDRTALILDIFAQHAHTHEGKLQVELAQCEYRLPRLTRLWTHLVRQSGARSGGQKGGVGLRGPGETQLESDRRQIRNRITRLKKDLEDVRAHRSHYRQTRKRKGYPTVSLVGYTNAGKSSLLKALTEDDVYVADQLFATLDPKTRRVRLPSGRIVLFTDTVGFIDKLPHDLVAAFRATLEEIAESDLIIRLADISHHRGEAQLRAVEGVLREIGVHDKKALNVWNKTDLVPEIDGRDDGVVRISALTGDGIEGLLEKVDLMLGENMTLVSLVLPYTAGELLSLMHTQGIVESTDYTEEGISVQAYLPRYLLEKAHQYRRESAGITG